MGCKSELRRRIVAQRARLGAHDIRRRSAAASSRLLALPEFQAAGAVLFFVSFGGEIDTVPTIEQAIAQGKRVAAPRADPERRQLYPCAITDVNADLALGAHSIREPRSHCHAVPLADIDVVVVPAAVWGEDGYRIGYGGGYYDRFLARIPRAVRVGFGFEMQVVPEVPRNAHDLPVDVLVTDEKVRRFERRRGRAEHAT